MKLPIKKTDLSKLFITSREEDAYEKVRQYLETMEFRSYIKDLDIELRKSFGLGLTKLNEIENSGIIISSGAKEFDFSLMSRCTSCGELVLVFTLGEETVCEIPKYKKEVSVFELQDALKIDSTVFDGLINFPIENHSEKNHEERNGM